MRGGEDPGWDYRPLGGPGDRGAEPGREGAAVGFLLEELALAHVALRGRAA